MVKLATSKNPILEYVRIPTARFFFECFWDDDPSFKGVAASKHQPTFSQWEFQDPEMEVLYHIRPYFAGIIPYIGLT